MVTPPGAGQARDPTSMNEAELMAYVLDLLLTGQRQPLVTFTAEALTAIAEEHIGEHFSRYPFLY